jgi:hypothetical protein
MKLFVALGAMLGTFATTAALALPATASAPQPVTISVQTVFSDSSDPFISTGGIVCASGSVSTTYYQVKGYRNGRQSQLLVRKQFVCADGTFDLLLHVTSDFATTDNDSGTWAVTSGTGAYTLLHGTGTIIGTATGPNSIDDEYTGSMQIG